MMDEWSNQSVHIHSTSALPAHDAPMAIASVLQGSITAMNVTRFIVLQSKTIFYHLLLNSARKRHPKTLPQYVIDNSPTKLV